MGAGEWGRGLREARGQKLPMDQEPPFTDIRFTPVARLKLCLLASLRLHDTHMRLMMLLSRYGWGN